MAKKTIDSKVWKDNFFSVLTPKQKLLWLYLITCDFNNMLGIYEINLRIVSFDTGLSLEEINDYLALFESKGKIVVKGDYLNLVNFLKHQNYNPNMKKSALNVYQDLPDEMKIKGYDYFDDFDDMVKAFGFANKVLEVKKPNTKNELFNEFYLKYNKIGRREEALSEFNMLTKEEQQLCLKSIPKYLKTVNDKKYQFTPQNYIKNRVFEQFTSQIKDYQKAVELLREYDVVGNKQTYKGQDYHYPDNVEYVDEIKQLERDVREGWQMSVVELYNKINE